MSEARIAVIADREAAAHLRLAGMRKSWAVKDKAEAEKRLESLFNDPDVSLILATEQVFEWVKPKIPALMRGREYPVVVSIAGKEGPKEKADMLAEIVKRTVGVDVKIT